jgi:hypothetical protein
VYKVLDFGITKNEIRWRAYSLVFNPIFNKGTKEEKDIRDSSLPFHKYYEIKNIGFGIYYSRPRK